MAIRLRDMPIGPKIIGGFGFVALTSVLVGLAGYLGMGHLQDRITELYEDRVLPIQQVKEYGDYYLVEVTRTASRVNSGVQTFADGLRVLEEGAAEARTRQAGLEALREKAREDETLLLNEVLSAGSRGDELVGTLREIFRSQDYGGLGLVMGTEFFSVMDPLAASVDQLTALEVARADEAYLAAAEDRRFASMILFLVVAAALLFAVGAGTGLARSITGRLALVVARTEGLSRQDISDLNVFASGLATGDLDVKTGSSAPLLEIDDQDEVGVLARAVDEIVTQTRGSVRSAEQARDSVRGLVAETRRLTDAARQGRLDERGDVGRFTGAYRQLVEGINSTLDEVLAPVTEASDTLERMADRDLSARMVGEYRGDHARIKNALNQAAANLEDALSEVRCSSQEVASAARQINSGSQELADATSAQAGSLEEVSASLQQLTVRARDTTTQAQEAREISRGASGATRSGRENMLRLSEAMERIKDSSDSTSRIVRTIDEIAFQTNLLALNAAVEAARAGDAGKGFAVVAEEVRTLARRSAEAARETSELIEGAVRNADEGVELNREVLANLEEIGGQVERMSTVMGEIALRSTDQSQEVEQIARAVDRMNGVTQQTAANTQESAASSEELSSQAARLRELVDSFQLRSSSSRWEPNGSPPPRASQRSSDSWFRPSGSVPATRGPSARSRPAERPRSAEDHAGAAPSPSGNVSSREGSASTSGKASATSATSGYGRRHDRNGSTSGNGAAGEHGGNRGPVIPMDPDLLDF